MVASHSRNLVQVYGARQTMHADPYFSEGAGGARLSLGIALKKFFSLWKHLMKARS